MNKEELIGRLAKAVETYNKKEAEAVAREALDSGIDPLEAINSGLLRGMTIVGDLYSKHRAYLPQLLGAGNAMYAALDVLLPAIPDKGVGNRKKVTLSVVEGDVHDIGKNIYRTLLTAGGFEVYDLGKDVPAEKIAETALETGSQYVALSALMTTTMFKMKDTLDLLEEDGYRSKVKVCIGGSPTSPQFVKDIGADYWDRNANEAVQRLLKEV